MAPKKNTNKLDLERMTERYLAGKASAQEQEFLETYYAHFEQDPDVLETMTAGQKLNLQHKMESTILNRIEQEAPRRINYFRYAAAAVFALVVTAAGLYFYNHQTDAGQLAIKQPVSQDVAPGGNKALLTLSDGRTISLDDAKAGTLTEEHGSIVRKDQAGLLVYNSADAAIGSDAPVYNTIQTPKGGEYQVILPDGSKVWLNSASTLRFPTAFRGRSREVELTGEGYFEVAKNAKMPFKVHVNDMEVKVFGTHFNIMAYANEPVVKTTLLEGSVAVSQGSVQKMLVPGQQAQLNKGEINISKADTEEAVAWKNGYFKFNRDNIQAVMRQLSRWYDVDVAFTGTPTGDEFSGKIRRNVKLSKAVEIVGLTNVHYRIEGKKITIIQ